MNLTRNAYLRVAIITLGILCITVSSVTEAHAQASTLSAGSFDFNANGIEFRTIDSANDVVMRFRMQNWANYYTVSTSDLSAASTDFVVRRLRLRFGGNVFTPNLTFNLQLSFSRSDQDVTEQYFAHIVRDAMLFWNFSPDLQVGFGQTKLPGNRQRVISSGDLEFADRSIVNGAFTTDRDFGFQGFWRPIKGDVVVNLRGAITEGDGRNQKAIPGGGLAYTGRVEVLPFGSFKGGGDYFEGDILRESTPKVSIGLTAHHNEGTTRNRGTLGEALFAQRNADIIYADALLKYSGLSVYGEYAQRTAANPITYDPKDSTKTSALLVGNGWMAQATYITPFMLSIGLRYAVVDAGDQLKGLSEYRKDENMAANVTYYVNKHRVKTNLEIGLNTRTLYNSNNKQQSSYYVRYNFEFGI
jgi:phosphate-selective porin OprO and OprP